MRIVLVLPVLALSACAVVSPEAWTFDPTQPKGKPVMAMADASGMTDRTAQLQLQRNEIRARIASEPDVWKRLSLYRELHSVGMQLSPLERRIGAYASAR
jgi:hypothetical protein